MNHQGLSQDASAAIVAPPPPQVRNWWPVLGWGLVVATAVGIFWGVTSGPMGQVIPNRQRRRTSRRRRRRSSRRRSSRQVLRNSVSAADKKFAMKLGAITANPHRYKALSVSARRAMPDSYFALSGRRFPIRGPVGSSHERDKWQAMQAIRYLNMGRIKDKRDYLDIRNTIIRRYGSGFWRASDGPTWPKIQKAKRKRSTTRRPRRRLAANSLPGWMNKVVYWGRTGNAYYVQAPNKKVRLYRGEGAKVRASRLAAGLAAEYGLPKRKSDRKHGF